MDILEKIIQDFLSNEINIEAFTRNSET